MRLDKPIFADIFGTAWPTLPLVIQKHYRNRPYCSDRTVVEGTLDVTSHRPLTYFTPFMKLMGQIPIQNEKNVATTVEFSSNSKTKAFHFNRTFYFTNAKPYAFQSRMIQVKDNQVIEIMRFGLGWRMLYSWNGQKVILEHKGYTFSLGNIHIPLPLHFFLGTAYAEETPVDDNTFDMLTHITHPLWGRIYEYKGRFKIVEDTDK